MKKFIAFCLSIMICISLAACGNRQLIDTTFTYNRAIISLPNGEVIDGEIQSWRDYEDGDQIQVRIDGVTYLIHSSDVSLIKE